MPHVRGQLQDLKTSFRALSVGGIIMGNLSARSLSGSAIHRSKTHLSVTSTSDGCRKLIEVLSYGLAITLLTDSLTASTAFVNNL